MDVARMVMLVATVHVLLWTDAACRPFHIETDLPSVTEFHQWDHRLAFGSVRVTNATIFSTPKAPLAVRTSKPGDVIDINIGDPDGFIIYIGALVLDFDVGGPWISLTVSATRWPFPHGVLSPRTSYDLRSKPVAVHRLTLTEYSKRLNVVMNSQRVYICFDEAPGQKAKASPPSTSEASDGANTVARPAPADPLPAHNRNRSSVVAAITKWFPMW